MTSVSEDPTDKDTNIMSLSKYDALIGTSYIPTDAEMQEIKQILNQPLSRIAQIEATIGRYESEIKTLRKEQDDLNHSIDKYRVLISPMHRLPADVLREIFILCLPIERNSTMSNNEAPILLTRITSHWRSVALTTPALWSSIHIAVPRSTPMFESVHNPNTGERVTVMQVTERRAKAINEWLSRAGMLPLNISLNEWDVYPSTEYCKMIIRCILPYISRWKNLSVTAPADSFADIKAIQGSDTPVLESVKLNIYRDKHYEGWGADSILAAPRISRLALTGIKGAHQFPVDWSKLTRLDFDGNMWTSQESLFVADLTDILKKCHSLKSCRLHIGFNANPGNRVEFPLLSLPALESLWMFEGTPVPEFFQAFDAPNLRKIEHYYSSTRHNNAPSSLLGFMAQTNGRIEDLTIAPRSFSPENLLQCLAQCPLLTTLSLTGSMNSRPMDHMETTPTPMTDSLLESFAPSNPSDECLCPQLEKFECLAEAHFSEDALLKFIQRKQSGYDPRTKKLKSISVAFKRSPADIDINTSLTPYVSDGLKVNITYPPAGYRSVFSLYDGIPSTRDRYYQPPIY